MRDAVGWMSVGSFNFSNTAPVGKTSAVLSMKFINTPSQEKVMPSSLP